MHNTDGSIVRKRACTCSQIRKHKTNHLLIGRKALAVADEASGSRKGKGERKTLLIKWTFITWTH